MSQTDEDPDKVPIPDTDDALLAQCRVDTFRAGGKGGQHQNKTETGVRLVHLPTGLAVSSRRHRSQSQNRRAALERLRARLEAREQPAKPRVPTRIPARAKRARLEEKKRRGRVKELRERPKPDD